MIITIELTQGQTTIIDVENADLAELKWCAIKAKSGNYYAMRHVPIPDWKHQKNERLARVILERKIGRPLEKHERADHINGNTLDNREENLRSATNAQNTQNQGLRLDNTSGYKGVTWDKRDKKWKAQIEANGKGKSLGNFDTPELAYQAYCEAAKKLHGEFARFK